MIAHMYASLVRVLIGFSLEIVAAVILGFLIGWFRVIRLIIQSFGKFLSRIAADSTYSFDDHFFWHRRNIKDYRPDICLLFSSPGCDLSGLNQPGAYIRPGRSNAQG
ncbi:MAG: hypothetical protein U5R30_09605 [Deltaproteobacteria bacterium]|nr:hypothetical protein [Deltaproteobacteria bacterium]